MRNERTKRWRDVIPQLWVDRPGAIYRWLVEDTPAWGSFPILNSSGSQCTTHAEVDAVVRAFWVNGVWNQHARKDAVQCWEAFQASLYFAYIPRCQWPHAPWSLARVKQVLRSMREASSPGVRGIPIGIWRSLPDSVLTRVADPCGEGGTLA